jgi:hypothetical protein
MELVQSGFLLANLGHQVSPAWGEKFMAEVLKFRVYYGGELLTHVLWCVVRLGLKPSRAWLEGFAQQAEGQWGKFPKPYQLAFTLGCLQKLGAPLSSSCIDAALQAFSRHLAVAAPTDTVLLLATVARLQHVTSYSWLQQLLDSLQAQLPLLDGQELATAVWSLAMLHHQPEQEWLEQLLSASHSHLALMTPTQAAEFLWSVATLGSDPGQTWVQQWLLAFHSHLAGATASGRELVSVLGSLAALGYCPDELWLQHALQLLHFRLREVDPQGLASLLPSLVKLNVTIQDGPWLENFTSTLLPRLGNFSGKEKADLITCYAAWGVTPPPAWLSAFQLHCVMQGEVGGMTGRDLEQIVIAICSMGTTPSTQLLQLWYQASEQELPGWGPDRVVGILAALKKGNVQPGGQWLQQLVGVVRDGLMGYNLGQLRSLLGSLVAFEAAGAHQQDVTNFISYLKEFFV